MALTAKEVAWVAHLARIELSEEMAGRMAGQLSQVLDYIAQLNEADTSETPPMSHAGGLSNVFREDAPGMSLPREEALRNAPESAEGFFRVPRVIE